MSKFEEAIMAAIAQQFFSPVQVQDQYGGYINRDAPVMSVARQLLAEKQGELTKKIVEKLDIDEIAEQAATELFRRLTSGGYYSGTNMAEKEKLDKLVREKLAAKIADRLAEQQGGAPA
jgi:hypothetical protein